jgi:hypothetical protein
MLLSLLRKKIALLPSQSQKRKLLQRTTRRDRHLPIRLRKCKKWLLLLLVIPESAIGTQQPIAYRFNWFGRLALSKRRTPKGQDPPSLDHSQPSN